MSFKTNPAMTLGLGLFALTMLLRYTVGLPHVLTMLLLAAAIILELAGVVRYRQSLTRRDKSDGQQGS